uniref:Hexosyltransferase n=1 Tax=Ditylenchus dipsaci TaxID=166011 RepID=A0A915DFJ3_9BILA
MYWSFLSTSVYKKAAKLFVESTLKVLLEPSGLRTSHNRTRVLVVRSAPRHNTYRNYIRQTWKKEINREIPVIFVSGRDEYNNQELDRESRQFNDILQLDFIDSYRNLTLKMMNIYRHMLESTNATQIIVINDDTIVNASALKKVLQNAETNYPNTPYIVGKVSRGYPRLIFPWLPWYVPSAVYPNQCYPVFTQGSSFVISAQAASRILESICDFPTIHLDDVMMGKSSNNKTVTENYPKTIE